MWKQHEVVAIIFDGVLTVAEDPQMASPTPQKLQELLLDLIEKVEDPIVKAQYLSKLQKTLVRETKEPKPKSSKSPINFEEVLNSRCFLRLADFHKAVFKPLIFTGSLRLRPSAMGFTDCSRRRSSSMAGCSLCTRSTQLAEILRLIDPLYGAYDFFSILFVCDDDDDDG
ncbi:hypothetical protein CFP56_013996 [Quercus suber]|uniref:Uncharacterized protein n=1 Tax=Quercus suber TaxID=58331 RepID=A0AAW0KU84_QUESU